MRLRNKRHLCAAAIQTLMRSNAGSVRPSVRRNSEGEVEGIATLPRNGSVSSMNAQQISRYRKMTPTEKANLFQRLWNSAWQLKEAGLRAQHPNWDETRIRHEVRNCFLYARD